MTDTDAGHGHDESPPGSGHGASDTSTRTLAIVSLINLAGFLVELAGGLLFGSVALVSDAFHMLFDALAYVMAFAAAYAASRYGDNDRWSYGLHRLEPLAAFLNGLLLLPMVGFIVWESYQRFLQPVEIGVGPTLVIATGGLLVNVASVYVLGGGEMSLNERGAFYHLLGDAGGSIAVIVSTVVVAVTGIEIVDPITAGLIAALVTWSALKVLRGSSAIFFQRTPLDPSDVRADLEAVDGVDRVTDFHAWQICSQITVATAHVQADTETVDDVNALNHRLHDVLAGHGVDHATVEVLTGSGEERSHLSTHSHG
jgi:cobalt-zinc-cadmium efflux system protein